MQTKNDLVKLLSDAKKFSLDKKTKPIALKSLTYYANPNFCKERYKSFEVKKKSGGARKINAPVKGLKTILQSLNFALQCLYTPHNAASGFVQGKSVVDNAKKHAGHFYVFNTDLKDFFHSFDRNRVKRGFMKAPFNLKGEKEPLAFLLASLCTHPFEVDGNIKTVLPQGSPASPTITNILCNKLDKRLTGLAKRFGAVYSRYADDITFSSYHNFYKDETFRKELQKIISDDNLLKFEDKQIKIGPKLRINHKKTRLQKIDYRQEVTGLVVNEKVNVRRRYVKKIRQYLYYWEKYGYVKAQRNFKRDYSKDKGHVKNKNASLANVLSGKLNYMRMVKGSQDSTYLKLQTRFDKLANKYDPKNEVLKIWEEESIEKAMDFYSKKMKNQNTKKFTLSDANDPAFDI